MFPCNSKDELEARKRFHIEANNCVNKMRNDHKGNPDYNAEYHKKHIVAILARKGEKVICECGDILSRSSLFGHKQSQKHKKLMIAGSEEKKTVFVKKEVAGEPVQVVVELSPADLATINDFLFTL